MGETPNDSGELPTDRSAPATMEPTEAEQTEHQPLKSEVSADPRAPAERDLHAQFRRPAVWGLLVLIIVTLALQIWLLFL